MIESQDAETIMKLSKTESCIKEMILHMGTPSVLIPIVDFLAQLEGQTILFVRQAQFVF